MELCLVVEDWLLLKGNFRRLCASGLPNCAKPECPRIFCPTVGTEGTFSDFLNFLSDLGYSGGAMSSLRVGEWNEPRKESPDYRLYFVRKGEGFRDRAVAVLRGPWQKPRTAFRKECPLPVTAEACPT